MPAAPPHYFAEILWAMRNVELRNVGTFTF